MPAQLLITFPEIGKSNAIATETASKEIKSASLQKLSLREFLQEKFVILHCNHRNSPIINLVLIAWEYYGPKLKVLHIKDSPEFDGKPKLEYEIGKSIEGEAAIITYFLLSGRRKQNVVDSFDSTKAQVLDWVFYALNEVRPAVYSWVTESKGFQRSKIETTTIMTRLNECLLTRTYLVGERISCADISMVVMLLPVAETVMDKRVMASYRNVLRWLNTCLVQPEFIQVLGRNVQFNIMSIEHYYHEYNA